MIFVVDQSRVYDNSDDFRSRNVNTTVNFSFRRASRNDLVANRVGLKLSKVCFDFYNRTPIVFRTLDTPWRNRNRKYTNWENFQLHPILGS